MCPPRGRRRASPHWHLLDATSQSAQAPQTKERTSTHKAKKTQTQKKKKSKAPLDAVRGLVAVCRRENRNALFWDEEERARVGRSWTGSKIVPREAASSKGQVARKGSKVSERTNSGSCSKGLAALRLPVLGPALRLERSPRFGPLITSPCSGSTDTSSNSSAGPPGRSGSGTRNGQPGLLGRSSGGFNGSCWRGNCRCS